MFTSNLVPLCSEKKGTFPAAFICKQGYSLVFFPTTFLSVIMIITKCKVLSLQILRATSSFWHGLYQIKPDNNKGVR